MFYVFTNTGTQVDDGPFETRAEAEAWIADHSGGKRAGWAEVLTDADLDSIEAEAKNVSA